MRVHVPETAEEIKKKIFHVVFFQQLRQWGKLGCSGCSQWPLPVCKGPWLGLRVKTGQQPEEQMMVLEPQWSKGRESQIL